MRLAEATALFFASPLFITAISKIVLKETVGIYRVASMIIGFIGVILIIQPSPDEFDAIAIFPLFTALTYSISMMIARYTKEKDTVWQQMLHLYIGSALFAGVASLLLYILGLDEADLPSLGYIVRQWSFSDSRVLSIICIVAVIGSTGMLLLTSAYRIGKPSVVAPFEYSLLFSQGLGAFPFWRGTKRLFNFWYGFNCLKQPFYFCQRSGAEETACSKDKLANISFILAGWAIKRELNFPRCLFTKGCDR